MYKDYLKSKHWIGTRDFIQNTELNWCYICGSFDGLQVHHLRYSTLGFEDGNELIYLCGNCHHWFHFDGNKKVERSIKSLYKRMIGVRKTKKLPILPIEHDKVFLFAHPEYYGSEQYNNCIKKKETKMNLCFYESHYRLYKKTR